VKYVFAILFGTLISAVSQVMLKKSAEKTYESRLQEYLNPLVAGAYLIFVLATFCSIYAYKGIPLSLGPVLETTSYVYVTWFGVRLFGEKLTKRRVLSLILIIAGIVVASLSS